MLVDREQPTACEPGGAGRWSLGHLFPDQDGAPTLVEVKRGTDTRIRREIAGGRCHVVGSATRRHYVTRNFRRPRPLRAMRPVRDQSLGNERIFLQELPHQLQRSVLVSRGLDQRVEDLAFGVDGAPLMDHAAIDFQTDLIKAPSGVRLRAALPQVRCDHRSETIQPTSDCFVGRRHSTLCEQIFDVAQARREPEAKPTCLLNDLGRETAASATDFRHARWLPREQTTIKPAAT